jgi:sterol desaturase/sphingolipid hydroxylase (fatty acid hydroxylase superfamily)
MDFLHLILDEIYQFFGLEAVVNIIRSGNYHTLLTRDGFSAILRPVIPFLLVMEIIKCLFQRKFKLIDYKLPFFSYVLNSVIGRFISFAVIIFCVAFFERFAIFKTSFTWYWFIYGYIIWEFAHFIYHFLAHKVRLLWCLHSTHHAPTAMNLSIAYAHFFLEAPYADFIRTTICILLGVHPVTLFVIMAIDGLWGGFIHVSEQSIGNGKLGFLHRFILTPSHHRVHHAKNPLYMDTNFCNLLAIWDQVFKTYQPVQKEVAIEFGITRSMNAHSFIDCYFGEIGALARDVAKAPGWKNKILYIIMPPGWSHTGEDKTASHIRREYLETIAASGRKISKEKS